MYAFWLLKHVVLTTVLWKINVAWQRNGLSTDSETLNYGFINECVIGSKQYRVDAPI
jgi:hypothetical protein